MLTSKRKPVLMQVRSGNVSFGKHVFLALFSFLLLFQIPAPLWADTAGANAGGERGDGSIVVSSATVVLGLTPIAVESASTTSVASATTPAAASSASNNEDGDLIHLTDMLKIAQLGNVSYSPDGRYILFTTTNVIEQDDRDRPYTYRSRIWMVPADGSAAARPLTSERFNASQPAWHPSGRHLAFTRSLDGASQIMLLSLDGGEPRPVTAHPGGASSPMWSPAGRRLMFSSTVTIRELLAQSDYAAGPSWYTEQDSRPLSARPLDSTEGGISPNPDGSLAEIRAWLDRNESARNPRVVTRLNFLGETDLQPDLDFSHRYLVEVDVNNHQAEPSVAVALTSGYTSWSGGSWSADARYLYLSTVYDGATHPDRLNQGRIYRVRTEAPAAEPELVLEIDARSLGNPQVSPDGRWLAFSASDLNDLSYAQTEIHLLHLESGQTSHLTTGLDRSAGSITWSPDSRFVYFTANSNGGTVLYRAAAETTPARNHSLSHFTEGVRSFDVRNSSVAFVRTAIENPFELYTAQLATGRNLSDQQLLRNRSALTNLNASWLTGKRLSKPEWGVVTVDGFDVEYWIMEPTGRESGKTYPLMLQIHGGPSAMWGPGEASMWFEFQYFAARGYGIVYSNPRGSGGYGRDFQYGNYRDWGFGPTRDVLAATDIAAALPWSDPDRLVVTGGSYAGYLTAFIISQDHRFKAAFAQRGVYDLHTFLGEGNAWRLIPNHFGGFPWESAEVDSVLRANSPITYVDQIRTPLLIKHGDQDLRTGVIQSEMLYKALKIRQQPVEYVRYPRASHEMSRTGEPLQRIDRILRIYEYFERYVGERNP
jgi:dipeptidyl aminopeptidase/acylaminoacyl peptidase